MSSKRETCFTITKSHPTKSHPTHFQVLLKTISIFGFLLIYRKYYMIAVFIYVSYFLVTPYVYCKQYNFRKNAEKMDLSVYNISKIDNSFSIKRYFNEPTNGVKKQKHTSLKIEIEWPTKKLMELVLLFFVSIVQ